jgi:hypothetical protein
MNRAIAPDAMLAWASAKEDSFFFVMLLSGEEKEMKIHYFCFCVYPLLGPVVLLFFISICRTELR